MGRKKSVETNVDNKIEMNIQVSLECETEPKPEPEQNEIIQLINKPKRGRKPKNASINNAVTNSSDNVAMDSNIISNENIVLIHSEEQNLNLETTHPTQSKDPNIIYNDSPNSVAKKFATLLRIVKESRVILALVRWLRTVL